MLQEILAGLVAQTEPAGGNPIMSFVPFILIFAVMYFLIIRPQQKQQKDQQNFLSQLKKGDDVILQSGFFAKVYAVGDTDVTVEIAKDVRVRVLKGSITGPVPAAKATDAKPEEKKS